MNATDELATIRELAAKGKTEQAAAAKRMVLGLMRGDEATMKLGYTAENAAYAAADYLDMDTELVKAALEPTVTAPEFPEFLLWLHRDCRKEAGYIIEVVDKPHHFWQEHADYLVSLEEGANPAPSV